MNKEALRKAVQAALDGDWDTAHKIAQSDSDVTANWLHAVLHKVEAMFGIANIGMRALLVSNMKIMSMREPSF